MIFLPLPTALLDEPNILIVGAGGNGSAFATGLARMECALRELGHPGFHVTLCDPDRVTAANIGRQMFSPADVGGFKCEVLVSRINHFYGLDWTALPASFTGSIRRDNDLVVSCVDTAATRRAIGKAGASYRWGWWLDLGNEARSGQFVLGNFTESREPLTVTVPSGELPRPDWPPRKIPNVLDLFPALTAKDYRESNAPSCSLADSLRRQDLFINQTVATHALDLLWDWFRRGRIATHGGFINLETKAVRPLPIDPALWDRMMTPKTPKKKSRQPDPKSKRPAKPNKRK